MRDIFLFLGTLLLLAIFWSGCREAKRDLCAQACDAQGMECGAIESGFWNKFTCRAVKPLDQDMFRR